MNKDLHFSSASTEWGTPQWLYDQLNADFGFGLDACATSKNAKHENYLSLENGEDSLTIDWAERSGGKPIFMNPPYGRKIIYWVLKASMESQRVPVVCLLPARIDTKWWHSFIMPKHECFSIARNKPCVEHQAMNVRAYFIKGRLTFQGAKHGAPFPSAIVVMGVI